MKSFVFAKCNSEVELRTKMKQMEVHLVVECAVRGIVYEDERDVNIEEGKTTTDTNLKTCVFVNGK